MTRDLQTLWRVFNDPVYQAQFVRTLGHASAEGAEIGECLAIASQIVEGDPESWYRQWSHWAKKLYAKAKAAALQGNSVGARQCFLRSSNYMRNAAIMIEDNPGDPRILSAWNTQAESFLEASRLFPFPVESISIPFENTVMPGYLYRLDDSTQPRPTLIILNGNDGTLEELYFSTVAHALKWGYHCLTFDGPGQGALLRVQKIPFRPDWENVVKAAVDFAMNRKEIDAQKIALVGRSLGGYFAARAMTAETRIAACVVDPGIYDLYDNAMDGLPSHVRDMFQRGETEGIDRFFAELLAGNKQLSFKFNLRLWRYSAGNVREMIACLKNYSLKDRVKSITNPMLVCDNEQEYLSLGQAEKLFDNLTCAKSYHLFTAAEGAGGHCEPLAPCQFAQVAFGWLQRYVAH